MLQIAMSSSQAKCRVLPATVLSEAIRILIPFFLPPILPNRLPFKSERSKSFAWYAVLQLNLALERRSASTGCRAVSFWLETFWDFCETLSKLQLSNFQACASRRRSHVQNRASKSYRETQRPEGIHSDYKNNIFKLQSVWTFIISFLSVRN